MMKFFTLVIILFSFNTLFAQEPDPGLAEKLLQLENFKGALTEYRALLQNDPDNPTFNAGIAISILHANVDKSEAVPYLEKLIESDLDADNDLYFFLAKAYHYSLRFSDAIAYFNKYKQKGGGSAASLEAVDKYIEYCENGRELVKYPLNITFENLGPHINSPFADYYPFVPVDESFMVFNSKRKTDANTLLSDGSFMADVYITKAVGGEFQPALQLPVSSNEGNEEVVGLSSTGDEVIYYFDDMAGAGDLYLSQQGKDLNFGPPILLDKEINSKNREISATISNDGTAIYFASDRKGGQGGSDLYVSRKLPDGKWGPAQNLGPEINTPYDEDFPNFSPDGSVLYFSSKGHTSMGGFDIFKATWDKKSGSFTNVRNLGYPLNTPDHDMNFRVSATGRYGYIAAVLPGGYGDYDIHRVTFNEVEPRYSVLKGLVHSEDSSTYHNILMQVTENETGELFGNYLPNLSTMRYVIILPPGKYDVTIDNGQKTITDQIEIRDKNSFQSEIFKDYYLDDNE